MRRNVGSQASPSDDMPARRLVTVEPPVPAPNARKVCFEGCGPMARRSRWVRRELKQLVEMTRCAVASRLFSPLHHFTLAFRPSGTLTSTSEVRGATP